MRKPCSNHLYFHAYCRLIPSYPLLSRSLGPLTGAQARALAAAENELPPGVQPNANANGDATSGIIWTASGTDSSTGAGAGLSGTGAAGTDPLSASSSSSAAASFLDGDGEARARRVLDMWTRAGLVRVSADGLGWVAASPAAEEALFRAVGDRFDALLQWMVRGCSFVCYFWPVVPEIE
jgi:hypothetical protein